MSKFGCALSSRQQLHRFGLPAQTSTCQPLCTSHPTPPCQSSPLFLSHLGVCDQKTWLMGSFSLLSPSWGDFPQGDPCYPACSAAVALVRRYHPAGSDGGRASFLDGTFCHALFAFEAITEQGLYLKLLIFYLL